MEFVRIGCVQFHSLRSNTKDDLNLTVLINTHRMNLHRFVFYSVEFLLVTAFNRIRSTCVSTAQKKNSTFQR